MSSEKPSFWGRKTFCLITGASRGIGRQFAIEFGRKVAEKSILVLLARSSDGLAETKELVEKSSNSVNVTIASVDLTKPDCEEYTNIINNALLEFQCEPTSFDLAMIVHNAGSVGDVSEKSIQMNDPQKWLSFLSLNLVSTICLNSVFLNIFTVDLLIEKCVINITSLCGIKPFKSMAYYCVGKSSREMFFQVLAAENPSLNVISYSPGPVDTDMQNHVKDNIADEEVKAIFIAVKTSGKILTTEQTTLRCIKILADRNYQSGDHVDYFDTKY